MKTKGYTLCNDAKIGSCPAVEISDSEVTIGEDENTVKLKPEEWNILVNAIKTGKLGKVKV